MPTYKCRKCGNEITLSSKPGQCQSCQSLQFSIIRRGNSKSLSSDLGKRSPSFSKTHFLSSSLHSSTQKSPKTNLSTGQKLSSSLESSLIVPPAIKYQKTTPQPTLPLYSSPSNSSPYQKSSSKKKLNLLINSIILGLSGVFGYWLWIQQFNTNDFKKVVLQDSFKSAKNWSLTDGSIVRKGSLFKRQPIPYHYGASIWTKKNFTDVDFTADVTQIKGGDNNAYGITARVNGKSSENFYYLLIDGKGNFVLGKHTKDGWFPKVGWKKDGAIKPGNQKNNLRIVCKDNLIFGVINGKRVGSFRDQTFESGKIAVFSMRGKEEAATVYFDNALAKEK